MDDIRLEKWFFSLKQELETAYLLYEDPKKQSGFSSTEEYWVACRKPVADCIDKSGTFLDIGCANGYLLECIMNWTGERGIAITPFGLDLSEKLVELAIERLPEYSDNFYAGNAWSWDAPMKYDYARTELVYVPNELQKEYIERILNNYLTEHGKLLIALYRNRSTPVDEPWDEVKVREWGFEVTRQVSGYWDSKELTRVLVVSK
ncbi:class I SAM-dependent methyltransferase [Chloroflexota bacterium]